MSVTEYFCGLDLGQTTDPTAFAVLERTEEFHRFNYAVRHLERFQLGTSYVKIADRMGELFARPPLMGQTLAVDRTGVGRAEYDLLESRGLDADLLGITITAGVLPSRQADGSYHVPKADLVGALLVAFQSGRLRIARGLPLADVLTRELQNFRRKITLAGNEKFEAWREGQHDDCVLALAIAIWASENVSQPYRGLILGATAEDTPALHQDPPKEPERVKTTLERCAEDNPALARWLAGDD